MCHYLAIVLISINLKLSKYVNWVTLMNILMLLSAHSIIDLRCEQ
jgi:hypothetical protein